MGRKEKILAICKEVYMESTDSPPTLRGPSIMCPAQYSEWVKKQIKRSIAGRKLSGHSIVLCWSLNIMETSDFLGKELHTSGTFSREE